MDGQDQQSTNQDPGGDQSTSSNVQGTKIPNVLIDAALTEIRQKIVEQGYSEVHLPPSESEFNEKKFGITWNGTLILTNGKLRGLETLYRTGEATLSFNEYLNIRNHQHLEITFTVDLGLTSPTTVNDFRVLFMKKEMEGVATASLHYITFTIVLGLNILTRKMRLIDLKFRDLGHAHTDVKGLGTVLDFLASKISKIVLNKTKWQLAEAAEKNVKEVLRDIIENMKWPMPEQQNILIGGMQSAFSGTGGGGGGNSSGGDAVAGPSKLT